MALHDDLLGYDSVVRTLENLETKYQRNGYTLGLRDRQPTILHLIRALRQFGEGQFQFFYQGFESTARTLYPELSTTLEYSPDHVLAYTRAQFETDVDLIGRIATQRIDQQHDLLQTVIVPGNIEQGEFLWMMDELAATALWPDGVAPAPNPTSSPEGGAQSFGYDFEVKTVITYFDKAVSVRIVPYAQVALVGIPRSCLDDVRDLMSIPHEIGHFRFWYSFRQLIGKCMYPDLVDACANLREIQYPYTRQNLASTWKEEVFADVYGALLGGPLFALTAQDKALTHTGDNLTSFGSIGAHPVPVLRPLICIKAINAFGALSERSATERTEVAAQLLEKWQKSLVRENVLDSTYQFKDAKIKSQVEQDVSWDIGIDVTKPVDALVQIALDAIAYAFSYPTMLSSSVPAMDWGWSRSRTFPDFNYSSFDPGDVNRITIDTLDLNKGDLIRQYAADPFSGNTKFQVPGSTTIIDAQENRLVFLAHWDSINFPIPLLWQEFVTNGVNASGSTVGGKKYLEASKLVPNEIVLSGNYDTHMDPKGTPYPLNRWIRVYGAGGWTTEGPCNVPP